MTVQQAAALLGAEILSEGDLSRTVCGGYAGDLLSWVMGNVEADQIWITIMTNANVIAVALLRDVSAVLLSEGVEMEPEVLDKARDEGSTVLRSNKSTYALCAALDRLLHEETVQNDRGIS